MAPFGERFDCYLEGMGPVRIPVHDKIYLHRASLVDGRNMRRKVVRTEFEPEEYSRFAAMARKNGLTIKEALREAVLRWNQVESGLDPDDPIFHTRGLGQGKDSPLSQQPKKRKDIEQPKIDKEFRRIVGKNLRRDRELLETLARI
jgi:hypothetical protein